MRPPDSLDGEGGVEAVVGAGVEHTVAPDVVLSTDIAPQRRTIGERRCWTNTLGQTVHPGERYAVCHRKWHGRDV